MSKIPKSVVLDSILNTKDQDFLHSLSDHPDEVIVKSILKNPHVGQHTIEKLHPRFPVESVRASKDSNWLHSVIPEGALEGNRVGVVPRDNPLPVISAILDNGHSSLATRKSASRLYDMYERHFDPGWSSADGTLDWYDPDHFIPHFKAEICPHTLTSDGEHDYTHFPSERQRSSLTQLIGKFVKDPSKIIDGSDAAGSYDVAAFYFKDGRDAHRFSHALSKVLPPPCRDCARNYTKNKVTLNRVNNEDEVELLREF